MNQIKIEDINTYKFLSNLNLSENGKNAVFVQKEADLENNGYKSFLYAIKDGKVIKLTNGGKEFNYYFNSNDEIYVLMNREDQKRAEEMEQFTPVYKLSLNGGEAVKAFEIPLSVSSLKFISKDKWIVCASFDKNYPDFYKMSKQKQQEIIKAYKDNKDYEVLDESPFYFNGAGFTKSFRQGLFIFDLKSKKLERITGDHYNTGDFDVYGDKIIYTGNEYDSIVGFEGDIREYDLKTGKTKVLVNKDKAYEIFGTFMLSGKLFAIMTNGKRYGLNENPIIYQISGTKESVFLDYDFSLGQSVGSDCRMGSTRSLKVYDDCLYFLQTVWNRSVLKKLDENGNVETVFDNDTLNIEDFDIANDTLYLTLMGSNTLQEIYSLKDGKLKKLSDLNKNSLKNKYVATPQRETIKSHGYEIEGWVLYPKDFDKKKKYPAVLDIHGGPKTVYGPVFYHEMQVWASLGYFVFYCNPVGSDGRGNEFADIRAKYGSIDYKNIMDFTDAILEKYKNINTKKVCVTGGSYGGFMTNWIVGHTDRFVAAATQRSISNWISFEGVSDIGPEFSKDQNGLSLFDDLDKLFSFSPLKYAKNVKTPLLFIHSDEDYRCPLEQGIQYYTAIKRNGIDTKMVVFHGENHELSRSGKPLHRVKRLTEITNWFENHTK